MKRHLERAAVLLEQGQYALAEKELRGALMADPADGRVRAALAICLSELGKHDDATEQAIQGIAHAPDLALAHRARAHVLAARGALEDAAEAADESIRLDPYDDSNFIELAQIRFRQRQWSDALAAADRALAIDPENVAANNFRSLALLQLGRKAEATKTADSTLAKAPDDSYAHAVRGWAEIERGRAKDALVHFREALRLDPTNEFARTGMVTALKARNPFYRVMLGYFLWSSKLSHTRQWHLIIGGYIGYQILSRVAANNEALRPWLWPLMAAYIVFCILSWLADPLASLVLRTSRFGRMVLSDEERTASNWVGGVLGFGVLAAAAYAATAYEPLFPLAFTSLLLLLPLAGTFRCPSGWPRRTMAAATAAVAMLGVLGATALVLLPLAVNENAPVALKWFVEMGLRAFKLVAPGILVSTLLCNFLAGARVRK